MAEIQKELVDNPVLLVSSQPQGVGKWGMARLWRAWMKTTADFMAVNGVTMPLMFDADGKPYGKRRFNAEDAHCLFTCQWIGVDEDGNRLSWAKSGNHRKATKGERLNALRKHEAWALEKGIQLFVPRESEYSQLQDQEND